MKLTLKEEKDFVRQIIEDFGRVEGDKIILDKSDLEHIIEFIVPVVKNGD